MIDQQDRWLRHLVGARCCSRCRRSLPASDNSELDGWGWPFVAVLLDMLPPTPLGLHHQGDDQSQHPRHKQDDPEGVVGEERDVHVQREQEDRADHYQDDAETDSHDYTVNLTPGSGAVASE